MEIKLLIIVAILVALTVLYKVLPFRKVKGERPSLVLLPKYKKRVVHDLSDQVLEQKLESYGFRIISKKGNQTKFTRGSLIGDFSIDLAKVNLGLDKKAENEHEITVQAALMAAFDTGDHWQFITELSNKIKQDQPVSD